MTCLSGTLSKRLLWVAFPCWNSQSFYASRRRWSSQWTGPSDENARVAVLYQAIEPPIINGVQKPVKPGGYQDSGADIAYALREKCNVGVVTPIEYPDVAKDSGWCFPDTEDGILSAIDAGATHLWANTIVFSSHPLQISSVLERHQNKVRVVGQPPNLVEKFDDKEYLNDLLRKKDQSSVAKSLDSGHETGCYIISSRE